MERIPAFRAGRRRIVVRVSIVAIVLVAMLGGVVPATAQPNPYEACMGDGFRNVRIAWGDAERALAAPDAAPEVVDALTAAIQQVYRPDGTTSMPALEALLTPELREVTGMDCSGLATPAPSGDPQSASRQVFLDQVRQVDATTVSAFIVLPGMMAQPAPGATPPVVGVANGTPLPGTEIVDAVQFAIFVQQDGEWKLRYYSGGPLVVFSDVAPKGEAPSDGFIGSWTYPAADLRAMGMPAVPEGSEVVATPVASPAD